MEQELPTFPEHLSSPQIFSEVRVTRSLVLLSGHVVGGGVRSHVACEGVSGHVVGGRVSGHVVGGNERSCNRRGSE